MESIEIEMNFPALGSLRVEGSDPLAGISFFGRTGGASHCASHMVTTVPDNFFDRVHLPGVDFMQAINLAALVRDSEQVKELWLATLLQALLCNSG